jgi:hypothetical protein
MKKKKEKEEKIQRRKGKNIKKRDIEFYIKCYFNIGNFMSFIYLIFYVVF